MEASHGAPCGVSVSNAFFLSSSACSGVGLYIGSHSASTKTDDAQLSSCFFPMNVRTQWQEKARCLIAR